LWGRFFHDLYGVGGAVPFLAFKISSISSPNEDLQLVGVQRSYLERSCFRIL
jgi:hypothetical protein